MRSLISYHDRATYGIDRIKPTLNRHEDLFFGFYSTENYQIPMRFALFFIFIAVPLFELALLIKIGEIIGVVATVLLVIGTAMAGVSLLRMQGLTVLQNARASLDAGKAPIDSVLDGVLLLIAGAFLLTPGLLTDTVGFVLLVPNLRRAIAHWAFGKLQRMGSIDIDNLRPGPGRAAPDGGPTIDGEYSRIDDEPPAEPEKSEDAKTRPGSRNSPWDQ